ncbi:hypothetical protein BOQ54_19035 (plasmid) [Chelatococcus daeguensis]|uniref:Sugar transporter n=1 Tax=Chelatococcus daeguensis TaxID=444444 RepID=A0AAC9JSR8_9HYPH|nr:hypothetical protein [Chelatococcus daeguensis]APF39573.1 hypothetical protein BOQ54_19035 [Chelatococcus daeguensis]
MVPISATGRPPSWYWLVSGLALLWMLFGAMAWTVDLMTDEATVAGMREAQRQLYAARPQWLFAVYGLAILSGLAGALGLVLRKGWAMPAFAVSLAAIVLQFGYTFLVMDAIGLLGFVAVPFPLFIFAIGVFLLWFAAQARRRGWIAHR